MAWYPISYFPIQIVDTNGDPYSGAVLKAYEDGSSTPIVMATDSTGATQVSSMTLDAAGYVAVSGNVVIPHVQENCKLILYPTAAAATSETGAVWTRDNINIVNTATLTTFDDSDFIIQDDADDTKKVVFQLSSLATATTVTLAPPAASTTLAGTTIAQTFTGAQKCGITSVTSASGHIAIDLSLNNGFSHTMTEDTVLDNPTNAVAGQPIVMFFTNHASSPKTITYGDMWEFPAGADTDLTASNGAKDRLFGIVDHTGLKISCNLLKGFS